MQEVQISKPGLPILFRPQDAALSKFGDIGPHAQHVHSSQGSRAAVGRTLADPDQCADILVQREWAES